MYQHTAHAAFASRPTVNPVKLLPALPDTRVLLGMWAGAMLLMSAAAVMAEELPVRAAVDEAATVQSIATAARLCKLIPDGDLGRAASRMVRVHWAQMAPRDRETYDIVRNSQAFRTAVQASAERRVLAGCDGDLAAAWRDVESTLVSADLQTGSTYAANGADALRN